MKRIWILFTILLMAGSARAKDELDSFNVPTMTNLLTDTAEMAVETNSWQTCIENWEKGLYQLEVFSAISTAIGDWQQVICSTQGFNSIEFNSGIIIGRCGQEHVTDYPKVISVQQGVQKVRTYTRTVAIEGKEVITKWRIYSYPHEKLTTTTTVRLVKKTSVTTNSVDTREPHTCDLCGQAVK